MDRQTFDRSSNFVPFQLYHQRVVRVAAFGHVGRRHFTVQLYKQRPGLRMAQLVQPDVPHYREQPALEVRIRIQATKSAYGPQIRFLNKVLSIDPVASERHRKTVQRIQMLQRGLLEVEAFTFPLRHKDYVEFTLAKRPAKESHVSRRNIPRGSVGIKSWWRVLLHSAELSSRPTQNGAEPTAHSGLRSSSAPIVFPPSPVT